jgi:hypothetical protein
MLVIYTLDRFESELAVLLQKGDETVEKVVKKDSLPPHVKEGDILEITFHNNGVLKEAMILKDETKNAREQAESLLEKLKNKGD